MAHEHELEEKKPKADEKNMPIETIVIKPLDDGSFLYEVCGSSKHDIQMRRYSASNSEELMKFLKDDLESPHMKKEAAFKEVYDNEPKIVGRTREKFGEKRAQDQKIAIALSKAGLSKERKVFGK